jgi:hypothetical protein
MPTARLAASQAVSKGVYVRPRFIALHISFAHSSVLEWRTRYHSNGILHCDCGRLRCWSRRRVSSLTWTIFFLSNSPSSRLVYPQFPFMGDKRFTPVEYWEHEPSWKNLFENPAAVQFNHRLLAMTTYALVTGYYFWARKQPLQGQTRVALNALYAMANVQVALGIATLLYYVVRTSSISLPVLHSTHVPTAHASRSNSPSRLADTPVNLSVAHDVDAPHPSPSKVEYTVLVLKL